MDLDPTLAPPQAPAGAAGAAAAGAPFAPPSRIEDITADWLTAVLHTRYPGTVVTSVTIGTVIHGTATKVRLLLTYNDAGHGHRLPPTVWLKGGYEDWSEQQIKIYAGETCFYRDLAAGLDIGCPEAFFAHTDTKTTGSVLILEDLLAKNATFGHATQPVSPAEAARVIALHAKLHARYWGGDELAQLDWLDDGGALLQSGVIAAIFEADNWARCMSLPRGAFVTGPLRDRERTRALMLHMLEHDRDHAHCLVHGDAHIGNTFWLPDGSPGYLDWQTAMRGYWAHDVADFITTSMTIADRRHAERDLIDHYVRSLRELGVEGPDFDSAWRDYRRHALYNFGWAVCLPEWQPEEVCAPCTERACAAILDLGTLDAW